MKRISCTIEEKVRGLANCDLFSDLPPAVQRILAEGGRCRHYDQGERIFLQQTEAKGCYIVLKGKARVYRTGTDGREQVLHLFGPGDICGEVPVFEGSRYPASMTADTPLETLYLTRQHFLEIAEKNPSILLNLLAVMSRRLRQFVSLIDDLALKDVSARLAKHLLAMSADAGGTNNLELSTSKGILANRLGTIAETLSRTFKKLQQRDIVRVDGRRILILDRDTLEDLADGSKL